MTAPADHPLERLCLVTVGATVGFRKLTEEVLDPAFWDLLVAAGFTSLHVQCGPDVAWARDRLNDLHQEPPAGLELDIFDVKKDLAQEEMVLCQPLEGCRAPGVVISHAGSSDP